MSFLNALSMKKCKGSRRGNSPCYRSPAYVSPDKFSEEKARLIKLKEELKNEKIKNRVSNQEKAKLKAQLQEARKKKNTNKITDAAVSSSPIPPANDEKSTESEELQSVKKEFEKKKKIFEEEISRISEALKKTYKALETERNTGEAKVKKLEDELKQAKQQTEAEKNDRLLAEEKIEILKREKDTAVNTLTHTIKKQEIARRESHTPRSPTRKMTLAQSFTEHGSDEVRDSITDICSYCASKGNLRPATHFCLDCGVYGRYICGECLQSHNMFVYDHVAETIAMQSKNRRKQLQNDLAAERRKTESTAKELAGAIQELQIHKEKREKLQTDLLTERLKSESIAKELAGALQELESHKEKRLSSDAFSLTDQDRPTKIAEKLSELYDNQWTDAFDVLDREMDERQIIQTLLDALMRISDECRRLSEQSFFERVQRSIESPIEATGIPKTSLPLSDQFKQQIKRIRIFRAAAVAKEIEKIIKPKIKLANHPATEVQDYLSHCVEIGWLCAQQDPPLILKAQSSLEFDTNTFKYYTKGGKYVEFVVWPALYLNETGPLLAKCIAQGTDNKTLSTRDNAEFRRNQRWQRYLSPIARQHSHVQSENVSTSKVRIPNYTQHSQTMYTTQRPTEPNASRTVFGRRGYAVGTDSHNTDF